MHVRLGVRLAGGPIRNTCAMKRFGILRSDFDPKKTMLDPFATDQAYWRSLWPVQ